LENISPISANATEDTTGNTGNITNQYPTCVSQTEIFGLIYTIASVLSAVSTLGSGIMFQKFQTRVCRLVGTALYSCGCLFVATSSFSRAEFVFPGMILLVFSVSFFYVTGVHFVRLLPKARSTIISVMTGLCLSGSTTFWITKFAYDSGIALSSIFYFMAGFTFLSLGATFFLAPKRNFPHPIPKALLMAWQSALHPNV